MPLTTIPQDQEPVTDSGVIWSMLDFAQRFGLLIEIEYQDEQGRYSKREMEVQELDPAGLSALTFCRLRERQWRRFLLGRILSARWTGASFQGLPAVPGTPAASQVTMPGVRGPEIRVPEPERFSSRRYYDFDEE